VTREDRLNEVTIREVANLARVSPASVLNFFHKPGEAVGGDAAADPTGGERARVRGTTRWTRGRTLRDPLSKAPLDVLDAVEKALAALPVG
jgi:hypothetical protein